ncbi:MAG: hypothetical protein WCJ72_18520 [Chryseobacterium sp.]
MSRPHVRFGILSNNENNEIFNTSDSALGIGTHSSSNNYGSGNAFITASSPCGIINGTNAIGFYKALLWAR